MKKKKNKQLNCKTVNVKKHINEMPVSLERRTPLKCKTEPEDLLLPLWLVEVVHISTVLFQTCQALEYEM